MELAGNKGQGKSNSLVVNIMEEPRNPPKKDKFDTKSLCPSCGERIGLVESTCPFCGDEIPIKNWLQLSNDKTGKIILGIVLFLLLGYFFTIFYYWGETLSMVLLILGFPFYLMLEGYALEKGKLRRK